jgi:hypothetical protein
MTLSVGTRFFSAATWAAEGVGRYIYFLDFSLFFILFVIAIMRQ